ncbi:uncharacterized protein N7511_005378 [Penicillium nucicola]|uniref:uncharacterized protein n=1 Tax=Penicillium nucicola TaxID=1850975 RepID=UPI002545881D|nr:uncharacterized protein N7511_005378 [Penicillium nucicola]KAJ5761996.1 hypothetical protein N7511_005378 [Penicillium nucicola]
MITTFTPEQILDIEDALVTDQNPARDEDTLDFQRCARLHKYLVAYAYMARNGTTTPDLDALASESWFFNEPSENIDAIRARLDPSLNSFLDAIYDPTPEFFYWVNGLRMELVDESFPHEDNDLEDKERFVVIYDTSSGLGPHCLGVLYDQLNHRASFPLTIWNTESIEPVTEHWDMWFPLETILTHWIYMLRMGKITADPRNERDLSAEEADSRHQIGLWCWHPYCAAQIDSTVAAMDRYTDAIESRMHSLLPISSDAPFFTDAELDAALVPKECFIRSFLTRVRIPRFKLVAPGLEVPHDKQAFAARQMFNAEGQGRSVPSFLLFASADNTRTTGFNEEIHRLFFGSRNDVPFNEGDPVPAGLYSATIDRFEYDTEETGFCLLLPFALQPNLSNEDGARYSDGTLVPSGSFTQLLQHGLFHPFGGEHRVQRLEMLFDRWTELIESGVWTVGANGVEGGIDMFQEADQGRWKDYWISPSW